MQVTITNTFKHTVGTVLTVRNIQAQWCQRLSCDIVQSTWDG